MRQRRLALCLMPFRTSEQTSDLVAACLTGGSPRAQVQPTDPVDVSTERLLLLQRLFDGEKLVPD